MQERIKYKMYKKYIIISFFIIAQHYSSADKLKNVLFIMIDDLKPMIGAYGYSDVVTPNIDRLAERGMVFLNAHCQQALCGPSRVSMLTGMYPDSIGIYGMGNNKYKMRDMHPNILTLPQHFKNLGYNTIGTGKIFDPRNVEDDWHGPQDAVSWTTFFGKNPYNSNTGGPIFGGHYHNPELKRLASKIENEGKKKGLSGKALRLYIREQGGGPAVEKYDVYDDSYKDGCIANRGVEQLEKLKDSDQPFFLALGFLKPHLPFVAPKKYWDLYQRSDLELAKLQTYPDGAPLCAETDYVEARGYSGVPAEGVISEKVQRELIHGYLACVSYIDAQVGKVLKKLEQTGLDKSTVVVLCGDHGFHLGDKQIWSKHTNYEESTRSPLIISNTGKKPGVSLAPVNLIDVFPTLCELINISIPKGLDGKSLLPILNDSSNRIRKFSSSIYPRNNYYGIAIRTERYRYVAWYKGWKKKGYIGARFLEDSDFIELYDYKLDPLESRNRARDKDYKLIVKELDKLLRDHVSYTQKRQAEY